MPNQLTMAATLGSSGGAPGMGPNAGGAPTGKVGEIVTGTFGTGARSVMYCRLSWTTCAIGPNTT